MEFVIGRQYSRRHDLHSQYGGQTQGGISTPTKQPYIFIFTGKSGRQYGYEDGWQPDAAVFLYTGEGQVGDMAFTGGNKAIRDHAQSGKTLLLFEALGKSKPVEFLGEFECASYEFGHGPDREGNLRKTIKFHLVRVGDSLDSTPDEKATAELFLDTNVSLAGLRELALKAVSPEASNDWKEATVRRRQRSEAVKRYVLARSKGICELTGDPAPFVTVADQPYLEVHHITRRSDGGLDDPRNCAAITPNAHREIHHGQNGDQLNQDLLEMVKEKEQLLVSG